MATSTIALTTEQHALLTKCLSDLLFDLHSSIALVRSVLLSEDENESAACIAADLLTRLSYVSGVGMGLAALANPREVSSMAAEEVLLTPVAYSSLVTLRAAMQPGIST